MNDHEHGVGMLGWNGKPFWEVAADRSSRWNQVWTGWSWVTVRDTTRPWLPKWTVKLLEWVLYG